MNWFSVSLVFKVTNLSRPEMLVHEESCVVIQANNHIDATNKALQYGKDKEELFLNVHGETIDWSFEGIKHIQELETENEIAEVCSCTKEGPYNPMIKIKKLAAISLR